VAEKGQSYVVILKGVKSFRAQGKAFVDALASIVGVDEAKQVAFEDASLTVELRCKCTVSELQERIFGAAEKKSDLAALDVESVSGKKLTFKL
jgi:hypothetical protein